MEAGKTVKDVSPHDFVKAYAAHLKRSGKVLLFFFIAIEFIDFEIMIFDSMLILYFVIEFWLRKFVRTLVEDSIFNFP